jgi:hypothetical protein
MRKTLLIFSFTFSLMPYLAWEIQYEQSLTSVTPHLSYEYVRFLL